MTLKGVRIQLPCIFAMDKDKPKNSAISDQLEQHTCQICRAIVGCNEAVSRWTPLLGINTIDNPIQYRLARVEHSIQAPATFFRCNLPGIALSEI